MSKLIIDDYSLTRLEDFATDLMKPERFYTNRRIALGLLDFVREARELVIPERYEGEVAYTVEHLRQVKGVTDVDEWTLEHTGGGVMNLMLIESPWELCIGGDGWEISYCEPHKDPLSVAWGSHLQSLEETANEALGNFNHLKLCRAIEHKGKVYKFHPAYNLPAWEATVTSKWTVIVSDAEEAKFFGCDGEGYYTAMETDKYGAEIESYPFLTDTEDFDSIAKEAIEHVLAQEEAES